MTDLLTVFSRSECALRGVVRAIIGHPSGLWSVGEWMSTILFLTHSSENLLRIYTQQ